ncbi:hypothetical protein XFF6992_650021 [Xanthomonas citri pv. fuscans]|nr:hypothetical protein XFF6970_140009 [Xanthomonas citri pv. fuscans]SOO13722.1 hypothetical protein XFF7766_230009 [Xanthomonas citri pv. fuscans]SOO21541.1 hypothetical protein XFF6992_650021 [Xanthomonas citri pv. fuscans]SOO42092.1 hypothetical protein XFF1815_160009 [Xanthomonas citri pv. fuscans]
MYPAEHAVTLSARAPGEERRRYTTHRLPPT